MGAGRQPNEASSEAGERNTGVLKPLTPHDVV
jgi:hypothetical protein